MRTLAILLLLTTLAQADSLLEKAQGFQDRIPLHTPGYGMIVELEYTDESLVTVDRHRGYRDSTIWTGLYLAAQCWRYKQTGDAEAMAEIERMAHALHHVKEATGTPGYIGRHVAPNRSPFNDTIDFSDSDNQLGQGEYEGDFWISRTSRDMCTGWWFGLGHASRTVTDPALPKFAPMRGSSSMPWSATGSP